MIETISLFGKDISLYYLCWFAGILTIFLAGWNIRRYFDFSFSRATILVVLDLILGYLLIWLMSWISGGGEFNGYNYVRVVPVIAIIFIPISYIFNEPLWKVSDFLAASGAAMQGVSHLGCVFAGCCHGYPSQWGIYSNIAQEKCFPIQPIEAIINILIAFVLCWMVKKKKEQKYLFMWYMIMFGATRFVCEFYRNNRKVWHNISELALYALASLVIGIIALVFTKLLSKRSWKDEEK